ncbi:MAG: GDP-mannose 4,6-dehydratase [Chloroflexi bacterium]|nr:GDP-mannose 4,6-dehydratase [Chloroflexota bacterium]
MRVLVTGASGFVGRWLSRALIDKGHEVLDGGPRLDVTDQGAMREALARAEPDAVAHLAAIAFGPDAGADPANAFRVTVGGTVNLLEAARALRRPPAVLVTGSSDVYGTPAAEDLPLREDAPLRPVKPYALSKAAQESIALAYAARHGLRVVVTRSFNHAGPGQRPVFVIPALAERVAAVGRGETDEVPAGNLDVRRDVTDVRDVADAYVRLLEALHEGRVGRSGITINVCSGRSVTIRWLLEEFGRLAGVQPRIRIDPALVRPDDAPEIRGDPSAIEGLIGWRATTQLERTLGDIWAAADKGSLSRPR